MTISMEEVYIEIHQSALDEMYKRRARLQRQIDALNYDANDLDAAIKYKQFEISAARDVLLSRCAK